MELLQSLNIWAVLLAAAAYFFLGFLWYSTLFAKTWMDLRGLTEETIGEPNPVLFLWSFLLQLIATFSLGLFLAALQVETVFCGAMLGLAIGMGFVFSLAGTTGLFAGTAIKLHLIDNGYHVVGLTIAGAILAWFL